MQRRVIMHPYYITKPITMKLITIISTGLFIVLAALYLKKERSVSPSLYNTKWSLRTITTDTGTINVNTKAFMKFNEEQKSAGGNGSCNSFGSTATIKGDSINFSNIFSTKMYCEEVQQIENTFFNLLGKANRFTIKNKTLFLYQINDLLMEFVPEDLVNK